MTQKQQYCRSLYSLKNNGTIVCKTASRNQALQAARERLPLNAKNVVIERYKDGKYISSEVLIQWPITTKY